MPSSAANSNATSRGSREAVLAGNNRRGYSNSAEADRAGKYLVLSAAGRAGEGGGGSSSSSTGARGGNRA